MADHVVVENPASLLLRLTEDGKQLLRHAAQRADLGEIQREIHTWRDAEAVPWRFLMRLCAALRDKGSLSEGQSDEAWLHVVTAGSQLVLPAPVKTRDPALEERCAELRAQAQEREYQALVADVTKSERGEKERVSFGDALKEVGYGVHIITVMLSCFVAGYVVGRRLSSEPAVHYAVGCVGMIAAMFVEAGLFMIQFPRLTGDAKMPGRGPQLNAAREGGPGGRTRRGSSLLSVAPGGGVQGKAATAAASAAAAAAKAVPAESVGVHY